MWVLAKRFTNVLHISFKAQLAFNLAERFLRIGWKERNSRCAHIVWECVYFVWSSVLPTPEISRRGKIQFSNSKRASIIEKGKIWSDSAENVFVAKGVRSVGLLGFCAPGSRVFTYSLYPIGKKMRQPPILEKESFIPARSVRIFPSFCGTAIFCVPLHNAKSYERRARAAVNSLYCSTYILFAPCGKGSQESRQAAHLFVRHPAASPLWWIFERNYRVRDNNTWRNSVSLPTWIYGSRYKARVRTHCSFLSALCVGIFHNFLLFHSHWQFCEASIYGAIILSL